MNKLLAASVLTLSLMFSGCAMQTDVNQQIAASNTARFQAFTEGMVGCKEDAACKVGLSMAFAGGLGQQKFEREDSIVDYLKVGVPYANLGLSAYQIYEKNKNDDLSNSTVVLKDMKATDGGTINIGGFNKTQQSVWGSGNSQDSSGTMKPSEVVIVEPMPEEEVVE